MGLFNEFKEFAMKGNVVDLAVGLIIGAAFGGVVNSLVTDVLMPPLGYLTGKADFSELSIDIPVGRMEAAAEKAAAATGVVNGEADKAEQATTQAAEAVDDAAAGNAPAERVAAAGAEVAQAGAAVAKAADAAEAAPAVAAQDRVVSIRYGKFLNACIAFLVQAFAVFLVVKGMNRMRRGKEKETQDTPEEPKLTLQEQLLVEIRDNLKNGPAA